MDELLHFTRLKAEAVRQVPGITNSVGLLLTSVPEFFQGGTLAEYRERQGREEQEARRLREENRRYFESILADPQTGPEDRAWAQSMLRTLTTEP